MTLISERTLKALEWQAIVDMLVKSATSTAGKEKCAKIPFYQSIEEIQSNLSFTTEAKKILDIPSNPPFGGIRDIKQAIKICSAGKTLLSQEFVDILSTLKACRQLKNYLSNLDKTAPSISDYSQNIFDLKELEDKISATFDEAGNIYDTASPELKSLRNALKDNSNNLKIKLNGLLNSSMSKYLQDPVYTQRDGRYVFPVKVDFKASVPGIIHDVSSSGATIFVEPKAIVDLNNKIKEIELNIENEIKKILEQLSAIVRENVFQILENIEILAQIDFIFAKAKLSVLLKGIEPRINSSKYISIKGARHPILITTIDNVVPNDIEIGKTAKTLIITGSNTGGKTVILKTTGLSILMAKAGLHIPALDADIYPFSKVFADIGDEQSIVQSLSTFSSHMTNIINIVNNCKDDSLVLLDEVGSGTDPSEGSSIAQAVLEFLTHQNAVTVATTHYGELKALAYIKEGYENASVAFDTETLSPTYKLLIGIPGTSNAIVIAKNLGLDESIINRASEVFHTQKDPTGKVLEGLQDTQQRLSKNALEVETTKDSLLTLEKEYNEKLERIKAEKGKTLNVYKKKFESELLKARQEIKEIVEEIRRTKSEKLARRAFNRLGDIERSTGGLLNSELETTKPEYESISPDLIKIGLEVIVKDLNQIAEVLSLPDKNNQVQIAIGSLKTNIKISKLAELKQKQNEKKKFTGSKVAKSFRFTRHDVSSKLDLRGHRVEEGIDKLENYLDDASLANLSPVTIVHGHGTGALKEGIRNYLRTSPYVKEFHAGAEGEGGDGITVIELN